MRATVELVFTEKVESIEESLAWLLEAARSGQRPRPAPADNTSSLHPLTVMTDSAKRP